LWLASSDGTTPEVSIAGGVWAAVPATAAAGLAVAAGETFKLRHTTKAGPSTVTTTTVRVGWDATSSVTAAYASTNTASQAPDVGAVTLADVAGGARFTSVAFPVSATMTDNGVPASTKKLKAWVEGTLKTAAQTSAIAGVAGSVLTLTDSTQLANFTAGDAITEVTSTGAAGDATGTVGSVDIVAKTITLATTAGTWDVGSSVKGPLKTQIITPKTSAIKNVAGNVLTLTNNTGLANFQIGDVVQTGVTVTAITPATPSITVSGGSWVGTDGTGDTTGDGRYVPAQDWSVVGSSSGSVYNSAHRGIPAVFNGQIVSPNTNAAFSAHGDPLTYHFPGGGMKFTSLSVIRSQNGGSLILNVGEPDELTITAGAALTEEAFTLASGTLKSFQCVTAVNVGVYLYGFKINGKLLVDASIPGGRGEEFVTGATRPASNVKLFCKLDAAGVVSDLQSPDPGFTTWTPAGTGPYTGTVTFPATLPTGSPPDTEMPAGTTVTVEVQATNTAGTDSATSTTLTPA
jgi:hypothetical protein